MFTSRQGKRASAARETSFSPARLTGQKGGFGQAKGGFFLELAQDLH
jgi:hypothetical protein